VLRTVRETCERAQTTRGLRALHPSGCGGRCPEGPELCQSYRSASSRSALNETSTRGYFLLALYQRHHRTAEGRNDSTPADRMERLQHGYLLAIAAERPGAGLHAHVSRRRPYRIHDPP